MTDWQPIKTAPKGRLRSPIPYSGNWYVGRGSWRLGLHNEPKSAPRG